MEWLFCVSYFFAGAFLANGTPHFVSGVLGRAFQTPFAKPPGEGLSSSLVNVVWGVANLVVAYLLLFRVGHFQIGVGHQALALGVGVLVSGGVLARLFGRFHGGNEGGKSPEGS